jgi:hypothetical protein
MWPRLWKDVLVYNPDLVVISTGINDQGGANAITISEFKTKYNLLIQEIIAQTNCDIIIRTPNLTQIPEKNIALQDYNTATQAIAEKYNLGFFDLFTQMQNDIDAEEIVLSDIMTDNVHPNETGHEYIFQKMIPYFTPSKYVQKPIADYKMISPKGGGIRLLNTGAQLVTGPGWMNGAVLAFNNPGTSLEVEFYGSEFTVISVGAYSTGQYKIIIDGTAQPIFDTYRAVTDYRLFDSYKVSPGRHIVQIQGQATKNTNSTSTNLQIQGLIINKEVYPNDEVIN